MEHFSVGIRTPDCSKELNFTSNYIEVISETILFAPQIISMIFILIAIYYFMTAVEKNDPMQVLKKSWITFLFFTLMGFWMEIILGWLRIYSIGSEDWIGSKSRLFAVMLTVLGVYLEYFIYFGLIVLFFEIIFIER
jgi:hypothetical protein